jgi:hypothetical protein
MSREERREKTEQQYNMEQHKKSGATRRTVEVELLHELTPELLEVVLVELLPELAARPARGRRHAQPRPH